MDQTALAHSSCPCCGVRPPSRPGAALGWVSQHRSGVRQLICPGCARERLAQIEGGLPVD